MAINREKNTQKLISMPKELVQEIENYRFENRIKTESEAIRQLIKVGLDAFKKHPNAF